MNEENKLGVFAIILCFSLVLLSNVVSASASSERPALQLKCINPRNSLSALSEVPLLQSAFRLPEPEGLQCLAQEPSPAEIFKLSHTLSQLILFEQGSSKGPAQSEFIFKISEGVEVLARYPDWKRVLVRMLLNPQGQPYPPSEGLSPQEELILRVGDVASLAAKVDFLANLLQYLVHNLMNLEVPLPTRGNEITLTFNLSGLDIDIKTMLQGSMLPPPDSSEISPIDISKITVKISHDMISSEAELNPEDFSLARGELKVKFWLGPNSITGTAVFTKEEGGREEALIITAQVGELNLAGQAIFSSGPPEFKLQASLAGLLSFSALWTPEGLREPTLRVELKF